MDIIPVLDLRGGIVVRAHRGQRDQYRPLESPLSPTSDPADVMRGLYSVYPFRTFYVADLDAIMGTGNNEAAQRRLKAEFPAAVFWVDNGVSDLSSARNWLDAGLGHLVIGSESQHDMALMRCLSEHDRVVLSLDFRDQAFVGPPALLDDVASWPRRLSVITPKRSRLTSRRERVLDLVALRHHFGSAWLSLDGAGDRLLGGAIVEILDFFVVVCFPMDENADADEDIVRLGLRNHSLRNAIRHRLRDRMLGRPKHLYRLLGAFDRHLVEQNGCGLAQQVWPYHRQKRREAVLIVGEGVRER